MVKIKVGILGFGNVGAGVKLALEQPYNSDMGLTGIFTRRDPSELEKKIGAKVFSAEEAKNYAGDINVMILCGGSATDLPVQGPKMVSIFNTVA